MRDLRLRDRGVLDPTSSGGQHARSQPVTMPVPGLTFLHRILAIKVGAAAEGPLRIR